MTGRPGYAPAPATTQARPGQGRVKARTPANHAPARHSRGAARQLPGRAAGSPISPRSEQSPQKPAVPGAGGAADTANEGETPRSCCLSRVFVKGHRRHAIAVKSPNKKDGSCTGTWGTPTPVGTEAGAEPDPPGLLLGPVRVAKTPAATRGTGPSVTAANPRVAVGERRGDTGAGGRWRRAASPARRTPARATLARRPDTTPPLPGTRRPCRRSRARLTRSPRPRARPADLPAHSGEQ